MTRTARRAGSLLGALIALSLATAGVGAANTYTHVTCYDPDTGKGVGGTVLPDGWTHSNIGGATWMSSADCTGTITSSKGVVIGNGSLNPQGSKGILRFDAPAGTTIAGYRWWRVVKLYRNEETNGFAVRVVRNSENYDDPPAGDDCTTYGGACPGLGAPDDPLTGPFGEANKVEVASLPAATTSLSVIMFCDGGGGSGQCTDIGPGTAYYRLFGGKLTLEDNAEPILGTLGGTIFDGDAAGERTITVSGSDAGGGLYSAELLIDGAPRENKVFHPNDGRCADIDPTDNAPYEFAHPQPCKLSGSSSFTLDTSELADGKHTARVVVRDAAGNETASDSRTFVVDNVPAPAPAGNGKPSIEGTPRAGEALRAAPGQWTGTGITFSYQWLRCDVDGGACVEIGTATQEQHLVSQRDVGHRLRVRVTGSNAEGSTSSTSEPTAVIAAAATTENRVPAPQQPGAAGAVDRGTPNGSGATDRVRLSAYVGTGRSTTIRASYGRATKISGRLLDTNGNPIAGATLQVQVGVRSPGTKLEDAGTVRTDANGRYTYTLPAGPSRLVRFGYRSYSADAQFADTTDVVVMVRSGVRLKARPTKLRNGKVTTFSGTVARPVPTRGVLVDLQVRIGKRWRTFAVARTDRRGRFRYRYRFRNTYRTTTFTFRARARRDTAYPYLDGYSRTMKVKVRA